jgi:ethanolamine ammonia-lyase small subunit
MKPVDEAFLRKLGLPTLLTKCSDINVHLTRPDLGRQLSEEALRFLHEECIQHPQIQIYVSDGLSNSAIEHNAADLLPVLMDGLKEQGVKTGTPFFVKYGRVPTMDAVSEAVGAEVTCVLIGERPGLAAADSMSAYITYGAHTGIPESSRTVVSNIHKNGIQPVEAGAYLVDLLLRILSEKKSGVDLKL